MARNDGLTLRTRIELSNVYKGCPRRGHSGPLQDIRAEDGGSATACEASSSASLATPRDRSEILVSAVQSRPCPPVSQPLSDRSFRAVTEMSPGASQVPPMPDPHQSPLYLP